MQSWALNFIGRGLLWATFGTTRLRYINVEPTAQRTLGEGKPAIFALWHEHITAAAWGLRYFTKRSHRTRPIASLSRDGDAIANFLERLDRNVHMLRGSSSRGGATALKGGLRAIDEGLSPILTVDGPRGPRHVVKPGVIHLASVSQVPIVLYHAAYQDYVHFPYAWDDHTIPLPCTRGVFQFSDPIYLPSTITNDDIPHWQSVLRTEMDKVAQMAKPRERFTPPIRVGRPRKQVGIA